MEDRSLVIVMTGVTQRRTDARERNKEENGEGRAAEKKKNN